MSYRKDNVSENNAYGRTFDGITVSANLIESENSRIPVSGGKLEVSNFIGQACTSMFVAVRGAYVRETGTRVSTASVIIPAFNLSPNKPLVKATIVYGTVSNAQIVFPGKMSWDLRK